MVTESCREPDREDAGVRRARYCPGNDHVRPDRRPDREPDDGGWDARGPRRPVKADGNVASVDDL